MKHNLTILLLLISISTLFAQETTFISSTGQDKLYQIHQLPKENHPLLNTNKTTSSAEEAYLNIYQLFIAYQSNEDALYAHLFHRGLVEFTNEYDETPQEQLMQVTLLIQQSLLYWNNNEQTNGVRAFYKAHRLFRHINPEKHPLTYQKLNGLFNVFLSQIPENYQFWASLFGLEGDLKKGFNELHNYTESVKTQPGLHLEANTLNAYCLLKFGQPDDDEIINFIQMAQTQHSPLLSFVTSSLTIKNQLGQLGLDYVNTIEKEQIKAFPLLQYLQARLMLNQLNEESIDRFKSFLSNYKGHSFRTDALMRQAWWLHIQKNTIQRDSLITVINTQTKLPTSNDKQALKEIEILPSVPIKLLKARLLFDGGFYTQANQLISSTNTAALNDYYLAEYFYRAGRIKTALNEPERALNLFDKVIALTAEDTRYLGPYAAIEAAKIKLSQLDTLNCMLYLEKARELNTGQYKQDISRTISSLIPNE